MVSRERGQQVAAGFIVVEASEGSDHDRAGDLAGSGATHAVGNGQADAGWRSRSLRCLRAAVRRRSARCTSIASDMATSSLPQLEDGLADPNRHAERDDGGTGDAGALQVCAVGRAEVLDDPVRLDAGRAGHGGSRRSRRRSPACESGERPMVIGWSPSVIDVPFSEPSVTSSVRAVPRLALAALAAWAPWLA